ncbi:MAG: hypothetical protein HDS66_01395 [Bacteroidales bacterium]|nr:hypothetical protein [Bacteroidales bacterium]
MGKINDPESPFKKETNNLYTTTVETESGLQKAFNYCSGLNYEDKIVIRIANGVNPVLTHRAVTVNLGYAVPICCSSVTIIGEGQDKDGNRVPNKIYLDRHLTDGYVRDEQGNIRKNDKGEDVHLCDSIISIEGVSETQRVSVHIENLEFMPIGFDKSDKMDTFVPTKDDFVMLETHLIKIWRGDGITLYNVKSTLANGAITNVDLRTVKNVIIRDCELINYNAIEPGNTTGGNLWMRGSMENVLIANNRLEKFGNDEIFAVFGDDYGINSALQPIPTMALKYVEQRNVTVVNNSFVYNRPKMANEIINVGEIVRNDVFICFMEGVSDNVGRKDIKGGIMHDILFANNDIQILHPVRHVFTFWHYHTHIDVFNFRISNNNIRHSYVNTATSDYAIDFIFGFGEAFDYTTSGEIEISHNTINADESIPTSVNGHCFIQNHTANLNVHNNVFYVTENSHLGNAGATLLRCQEDNSTNRLIDNKVKCHYMITVRNVNSGKTINVDFTNNFIQATRSIQVQSNACEFNLRMENNYIETPDYYLLSRGFSANGSIWASQNVWYTLPTPAGSTYTAAAMYYPTSGAHVERLTMLSNVVTGARKLVATPDYPAADKKVLANNDF